MIFVLLFFIGIMKWLKIILFLYLVCCIVLFFAQEKAIFKPHLLNEEFKFGIGKEVEIEVEENISLNCLLIKDRGAKGVLLYLHGNKGNLGRGIYQSRSMQGRGLDVFIVDYRGYGKSDGKPVSGKQMLSDIHKVYEHLLESYAEESIYIVGYSLGTAMASYLAAAFNPRHVILVAPFSSLLDIKDKFLWMFPDFLLKYKFENRKYLQKTESKISIVHGTDDNIIPYNHSQILKELNSKIDLRTSKGQSHRGIIFDRSLDQVLDEMI